MTGWYYGIVFSAAILMWFHYFTSEIIPAITKIAEGVK